MQEMGHATPAGDLLDQGGPLQGLARMLNQLLRSLGE
jgi:hypothetical protein